MKTFPRKKAFLGVKLQADESELIRLAALHDERSLSDFARDALLQRARRILARRKYEQLR